MRLRIFPSPLFISVLVLLLLFSCNNEDTPTPPIEPVVAKFTIATSTSVGGSITSSQSVDGGQSVTITATAQEHYRLKQWTGDCGSFSSDNTEITITASKNCQIGAEFEKINYSITASSTDGGSVGEGELSREYGQVASFTAEPEEGYQLSGWTVAEGSECPDDLIEVKNKVTFTVDGDCSLEAVFTKAPRTITIEEHQNGEISITPSETVDHGDEVVVTATADEHYAFKGWSGSCGEFSADVLSLTITLVSDCTIEAIFEKVSYTITATSTDGGSVVRDGQPVDEEFSIVYGETSTLTAAPDKGYRFSGWTSDDCPTLEDATDVEAEFVVEGDCRLEAVFEKAPRMISAGETENGQITISPSEGVVYGDEVKITATANEHYQLKQWTGDCGSFSPDNAEITFTASEDCKIGAEFEKLFNLQYDKELGDITFYREDGTELKQGDKISPNEIIIIDPKPKDDYVASLFYKIHHNNSSDCLSYLYEKINNVNYVKPMHYSKSRWRIKNPHCTLKDIFEEKQDILKRPIKPTEKIENIEDIQYETIEKDPIYKKLLVNNDFSSKNLIEAFILDARRFGYKGYLNIDIDDFEIKYDENLGFSGRASLCTINPIKIEIQNKPIFVLKGYDEKDPAYQFNYKAGRNTFMNTFYHEMGHALLGLMHVSGFSKMMYANECDNINFGHRPDLENPKEKTYGWYTALKFMFTEQKADHCNLNDKNPSQGQTSNELYCPGEVENTNNSHLDQNAIYCSQGGRIN